MVSTWKIVAFCLLSLLSIFVVMVGVGPESWRAQLPTWIPHKSVVLGLDLQGGVHLALEMGVDELLTDHYTQVAKQVREQFRAHKIRYQGLKARGEGVSFRCLRTEDMAKVEEIVQPLLTEQGMGLTSGANGSMTIVLTPSKHTEILGRAIDKSIEVIRRRIDTTGTLEPSIHSQGDHLIILQIPGFDDPQRVRTLLGETAKLSFQWIHGNDSSERTYGWLSMEAFHYASPASEERDPTSTSSAGTYLVNPEILLTGENISDCRVSYDSNGSPAVSLQFTSQGGQIFSDLTRDNIGRRLGVILDSKVLSAPGITGHIPAGSEAQITNIPTLEEATKLSLMVRSGALPAPLKVLEEKVVGPGLGQDSVELGLRASGLAVLGVVAFMLCAYSWFGLFAIVGVIFNIGFLLASLILMGATLTLPGIAGIALTIGMAVDANVLINERIKEELRLGKNLAAAIEAGYRRAMTSILDSNLTTLIGSGILYFIGTGPVRGFAVTMSLGILISLFTAVTLTRSIIFWWLQRFRPKTLWI